ncbi:MAG: hypothetical protein JKY15_01960 [Deltaproteobacteria bacterium]|nr:hypothetical protein [Deltaproteobacteria bacterium]
MTDTIYKLFNQDDVIGSGTTERILFNDAIVDAVGNAYITRVNHTRPKAISGNQALGQGTRDQQPQGELGEFYTIEGVVPFMDGTLDASGDGTQSNATIDLMESWEDNLDVIDGQIIHGRFGFELNTVKKYKLTPVSSGNTQIGLLWVSLDWDFNLILNIAKFVLKLKVDRGDSN